MFYSGATDIERRSQNSNTAPCNGVVMQPWSSNWGCSGFCQPHTRKQTQPKCVHDLHAQTAVHPHLTNHGYFDCRKTRIPPIGVPWWDKDGTGPRISCLYLWVCSVFLLMWFNSGGILCLKLKEPCPSFFFHYFQTFGDLSITGKLLIFLITHGEFYSWKVFSFTDMNENVTIHWSLPNRWVSLHCELIYQRMCEALRKMCSAFDKLDVRLCI